ncbi:excision repair cross-complementing protein, partial [Reticulomyxa filosa]
GHKIRNPDAQITLVCKQLLTRHRYILTGAPLQNSLKDLWSLFDFIFPGRLGTLPVFEQELVTPIRLGGFNNATRSQIEQAICCANALKNIIDPFVLRRFKTDVKQHFHIPEKTEQVLFCKLAPSQVGKYQALLKSPDMALIRTSIAIAHMAKANAKAPFFA